MVWEHTVYIHSYSLNYALLQAKFRVTKFYFEEIFILLLIFLKPGGLLIGGNHKSSKHPAHPRKKKNPKATQKKAISATELYYLKKEIRKISICQRFIFLY